MSNTLSDEKTPTTPSGEQVGSDALFGQNILEGAAGNALGESRKKLMTTPKDNPANTLDVPRLVMLDPLDVQMLMNAHRDRMERYEKTAEKFHNEDNPKLSLRFRLQASRSRRKVVELGRMIGLSKDEVIGHSGDVRPSHG